MLATISEVITASASVVAIFVALYQLNKTYEREETRRREDLYARFEEDAFKVDAWVALEVGHEYKGDERFVMVRNGSVGPLRNVRLEVCWPDSQRQPQEERIPGRKEPWEILPQGTWIVQRKAENGFKWGFPNPCERPSNYVPQYTVDGRTGMCHAIKTLSFIDADGNEWRRSYAAADGDACLELVHARRRNLREFEVKVGN